MKLFVDGRKDVIETIEQKIAATDKTIWFHCASLGEFEQGVPIMEGVRKLKPDHKIVVSFFSPSGYENKKNTPLADVVVYLPMDTPSNANKFIESLHPSLVFFVKYEFWPNYLFGLQKRNIQTLLVSGVFRKDQMFFKTYGRFMRKALTAFEHFFLQENNSELLLKNIGFTNTTVSGDTRFDRVSNQLKMNNTLKFAEEFKEESVCIVCGSTWVEDESVLIEYMNASANDVKFIIAPHKIEAEKIKALRQKINKKTILHSEKDNVNISDYNVLIIDCIGLLTKLYNYADIAYVGGAMGATGLHNILEPATFGIPIVIGKNFKEFPEAGQLQDCGGLFAISNPEEASAILIKLVEDRSFRLKTGEISANFVKNNTGATQTVLAYISSL